ncbi:MAG TPA: aldehyde ferredoxin oxidoreductase family protein, partial [Nitrospirota bacterium]|nr:aldehyde ferredoxin oxidoreductase family protein [Nitrospirota bacterium]
EMKELPEAMLRRYVGGRGINSFLLLENTEKGLDPMGPDNPLIFGAGMLTGMPGPSTARLTITGKSPETGLLGDANMGGDFGSALAGTGLRHIVITGRAERPVYLLVEKGDCGPAVSVRDAAHLWGMDTQETQAILKAELGEDAQAACIGQAGENLVRFACVMHGKKNAAGRTGMGCLMGSKKLKAVVVKGKGTAAPHDPENFRDITRDINRKLRDEFLIQDLSRHGTAHLYNVINVNIQMGRAYNGLSTVMKDAGDISPETFEKKYYTGKNGCRSCPVACRHSYEVNEGANAGLRGEGPEYGIMGHMGPVLGINSAEAVLVLNDKLNRLGIDASSAGNIIAWAIELYQDGVIGDRETGGLRPGWNEPRMVEGMLEDIAHRRGFGAVLADGALMASGRFGEGSRDRLMWVKNLPQSDPVDLRFIKAFALGVSTATRGADHLRSRCPWEAFEYAPELLKDIYGGEVGPDPLGYKGKGRVVWWWESYLALFDALGLCKLLAFHCLPEPGVFDFKTFGELVRAGAGLEMTPDELFQAGQNIIDVERAFICREGVTRRDDYPPARYFEPLKWQDGLDEDSKTMRLDRERYDTMLDEYYACHGWDENGVPR